MLSFKRLEECKNDPFFFLVCAVCVVMSLITLCDVKRRTGVSLNALHRRVWASNCSAPWSSQQSKLHSSFSDLVSKYFMIVASKGLQRGQTEVTLLPVNYLSTCHRVLKWMQVWKCSKLYRTIIHFISEAEKVAKDWNYDKVEFLFLVLFFNSICFIRKYVIMLQLYVVFSLHVYWCIQNFTKSVLYHDI